MGIGWECPQFVPRWPFISPEPKANPDHDLQECRWAAEDSNLARRIKSSRSPCRRASCSARTPTNPTTCSPTRRGSSRSGRFSLGAHTGRGTGGRHRRGRTSRAERRPLLLAYWPPAGAPGLPPGGRVGHERTHPRLLRHPSGMPGQASPGRLTTENAADRPASTTTDETPVPAPDQHFRSSRPV